MRNGPHSPGKLGWLWSRQPPRADGLCVSKSRAAPSVLSWNFRACWRVNFTFLSILLADNKCTAVEWLLICSTSQYAQLYFLLLYSHQSATHSQTLQGISWQLICSCPVGWLLHIELSDCCKMVDVNRSVGTAAKQNVSNSGNNLYWIFWKSLSKTSEFFQTMIGLEMQ